jgi:hypothetical protein
MSNGGRALRLPSGVITKTGWQCTVIFYKVKCLRDGMVEWRCKGWGTASAGWDCVTRRKW